MTIEAGKLLCITEGSKKKKRTVVKLECQNIKKTKTVKVDINDDWLSQSLLDKQKESLQFLDNVAVEFERNENNDPYRIWEQGKEWDCQEVEVVEPVTTPKRSRPQDQPRRVQGDRFHNPYNFVPAIPRHTEEVQNSELGDRAPIGHGRYYEDCWSGRISVKLTTVTPLLISDAAEMTDDDGHKTYPVRLGVDGKPYLPPTSIKGMLRSAYEVVTNSRLSVFEKHDSRLAYRMEARSGNIVKPARVEKTSKGLRLRLLDEAIKLPYSKVSSHQHGECVRVKVSKKKVTHIEAWEVESPPGHDWQLGWACITGRNVKNKKNERVFIQSQSNITIKVDKEMKSLWEDLILDYQRIHEKELNERKRKGQSPSDYLGDDPGQTAWSRHVYEQDQLKFKEGILCYVELNTDGDVITLQPVTISRRLYDKKPAELLPESLHPTVDISELSPADRVFGWVNQKNRKPKHTASNVNAYKGQLRVHSVQCQTPVEEALANFGCPGLPLAILGEPKPAQTRFYAAEDKKGTLIKQGEAKEYGYKSTERGLRGRKVYPHHGALPDSYWSNPTEDRTDREVDGRYQEYRRPSGKKERDSQNKSIRGWVNPTTEFTFDIDVLNLSSVELGALLWLLSLPENHYHRLGGGKPLGFGSVRLEINWENSDLRSGENWQQFYRQLSQMDKPAINPDELIMEYQNATESAYQSTFEKVPFIAAFCRCAKGFEDDLPVHYPRISQPIDPEGKNYKWFTDNEAGEGLSLPSLVDGESLPLQPRLGEKSNSSNKAWQR